MFSVFFFSCFAQAQDKLPSNLAEAIEKGTKEREVIEIKRKKNLDSMIIKSVPRSTDEVNKAIGSHEMRLDFSKVSINRMLCGSDINDKNPICLELAIKSNGSLASCKEVKSSDVNGVVVSNVCNELANVYYGSKNNRADESVAIEMSCIVYVPKQ